ncbi:TM0106 family RecB-like putative nuclease [Rhodococcus yananensis]|uniref:TM0106 family RecB-like putative nuclease n=1 Tax=Rhodococcus yananensis TaxID=2879464 RepID=UPI001CF8AD67|nr:bifunctional RecB family nuclease/DEAD/DEAH box helicase [Rhodococcus yananensis]
MFLLDDVLVYSTRDIVDAARCEYALLTSLDTALGRIPRASPADDPMLERSAALGAAHERRVLQRHLDEFGDGVVQIPRPGHDLRAYRDAANATSEAARAGAEVIYQGAFFDGRFLGFCDFLVRTRDGYAVYDAKLARHARVEALLQLAAYADALGRSGIPVSSHAHLILGDDTVTSHPLADLAPVHESRRAHLETLVDTHRTAGTPARWGDSRHTACGRCDACTPQVAAHRDLLLVAGMRSTQRARLIAAGVCTIDALADRDDPVPGMSARTLAAVRAQAQVQLEQERSGTPVVDVFEPGTLGALPHPDEGDIFFDFEGDPLWCADGGADRGLEYLFGVVETDGPGGPRFRPFWAHSRTEEKQALVDFLAYLTERRHRFPAMHVYHYAAYEKSALLRLAGRHGAGEDQVDDLLRDGVLIDLYPIVRGALRAGTPSYSIKKLEPLYMPARVGDVADGGESVVAYATYCALRDDGRHADAAALLASIAEYNEADCVSTLRLRDWLLERAGEHGVALLGSASGDAERDGPGQGGPGHDDIDTAPHPAETKLMEFAGRRGDRDPDRHAAAVLAAAVGYHRRERKPFWWAHFDRLSQPSDEWADTRDTLVATSVTVDADWHLPPRKRKPRRHVALTGDVATGSTVRAGDKVLLLYEAPPPVGLPDGGPWTRGWSNGTVLERRTGNGFHDVLVIEEMLQTEDEYATLPSAVAPAPPPATASIERAIASAAESACGALPGLPRSAAIDVLRRVPPRTVSGAGLPAVTDGDAAEAITAALLDLDDSYVAVQGPPGTGKTFTGSRVVATLVNEHGWRVGVVGQSHSVVENMLDGICDQQVPAERIGKAKVRSTAPEWRAFKDTRALAGYAAGLEGGCVVGGTAWDFTNTDCIAPGELDLLVIDEAGQFSIANTVAVATCARRLLLLGDPRQLPQVAQGVHPEPCDESALGRLTEGHGALPADRGFFLSRTWRMHPELCARVSDLSYEGRLLSQVERTTARSLEGVAPGVHTIVVDHVGNATSSPEERDVVVQQIAGLLGRPWRDGADAAPRPLDQRDVLVVAPYNAQVAALRDGLAAAGFDRIEVGTVDRFQGRQAAVVLVSMTASAIEDIPRGMAFLLSRNRLNVALSRGQWCAFVVRSRVLTEYLPATPDGLVDLGAFLRSTR